MNCENLARCLNTILLQNHHHVVSGGLGIIIAENVSRDFMGIDLIISIKQILCPCRASSRKSPGGGGGGGGGENRFSKKIGGGCV